MDYCPLRSREKPGAKRTTTEANHFVGKEITGVENETSQTMLIQFKAASKRIELQKRA